MKPKAKTKGPSFWQDTKRDWRANKYVYIMLIPVFLFYILFCYQPMYGAIIAFKDFSPVKGILGSNWVGLKHFKAFFSDIYFLRVLKNTLKISLTSILFGFPAPIILALLLNELNRKRYKKIVQTVSYMPHFISLVVICGMVKDFTMNDGVISILLSYFGKTPATLLMNPKAFLPIYIISGIWQEVGWGAIIYIAAIAGVDQELYEAASIDGAGRWKQTLHVTLPSIRPTIVILLILRMGSVLNVGFEKVMLLYNPGIYDVSDVISTYIYRLGLLQMDWSYSTAVGLFNSVINFAMVILGNAVSKRVNESSLW